MMEALIYYLVFAEISQISWKLFVMETQQQQETHCLESWLLLNGLLMVECRWLWLDSLLCLCPLCRIMHTTWVYPLTLYPPFFGFYFFNGLMIVLLCLHIFWAGLILRMVIKFLPGNVRAADFKWCQEYRPSNSNKNSLFFFVVVFFAYLAGHRWGRAERQRWNGVRRRRQRSRAEGKV